MNLSTATISLARRHSLADLLRRSAARHPDRIAVSDASATRSFAQLDADASRIANALRERGVSPGERVAILSRNSVSYVQAIFGVARAGAVLVPINFMLTGGEAGYVLTHSRSVALLVQDGLPADVDESVRVRVMLDGEREGWEPFTALLDHADTTEPQVQIAPDDPAQVLYTSGTESRPKGAVLSHSALIAQYTSCIVDGGMDAGDVELHAMPLYHCAQQHCFLVPDIYLGATSLIVPAPEPAALLEAIERHRITKLFAPPTVWIALLRHPDFERRDLSSLRKGYYGAAIMPVEVLREIARRLPDVRLWNFYGQTEMAPLATLLRPEDQVRKAGSAGRPALNVETRVVDPQGRDIAPGEVGEIVHRSPHAMIGYHDDPAKTAEAFRGGWFHSGDLGVLDDEGYLYVVDRMKDMIKSGGENVASREVEEAIYEHPAVQEVAIFGTPDARWIEAVTAAVVPVEGSALEPGDVIAFCRERLA